MTDQPTPHDACSPDAGGDDSLDADVCGPLDAGAANRLATWLPDRVGPGSTRSAIPFDRPVLEHLQSSLPEPSPALLAYGLDAGVVLVSVDGSCPVGYLLPVPGGDSVHVAEVAVAPPSRREGRATELFTVLFASLAAGTRVTLAVSPSNAAAIDLYRSLGFERVARHPGYFEHGAALLFARD